MLREVSSITVALSESSDLRLVHQYLNLLTNFKRGTVSLDILLYSLCQFIVSFLFNLVALCTCHAPFSVFSNLYFLNIGLTISQLVASICNLIN